MNELWKRTARIKKALEIMLEEYDSFAEKLKKRYKELKNALK